MRKTLKRILPASVVRLMGEAWDGLERAREIPSATLHPWRRQSIEHLRALRNQYRQKRCFIIGNGPSLKNTDLRKLQGEYTIGMNRFFLAFPELGFQTSFYLCVNDLVIEQSTPEIQALQMPLFVSWRSRKWLRPSDNLSFLHTTYTGPKFARDVSGRVWEGGTVTYTALQLAYHLGFQKVILIGVDHNYVTQGTPNATVTSQGDDPNHFHPGYFGKGFRWQLPDLITWERAYALARKTYENDGRQVVDATVGGKLQVFTKVAYESLF